MEKAVAIKARYGKRRISDLQSIRAYSKFLMNESVEIEQAISTMEALRGVVVAADEKEQQAKHQVVVWHESK